MNTYFNTIEEIVQETVMYMNRFKKGHINTELCKDEDEGVTYYIIDVAVYGYVKDTKGNPVPKCRTFEFGYTGDHKFALRKAVEVNEAMKKITAGTDFDLKGIIELEY